MKALFLPSMKRLSLVFGILALNLTACSEKKVNSGDTENPVYLYCDTEEVSGDMFIGYHYQLGSPVESTCRKPPVSAGSTDVCCLFLCNFVTIFDKVR